ncbi:MAG: hypothetical protein FVQ78_09180 [Solirubrobacterales bacterium]|nr:hypothetical protein [Solirubrobacterales bacterium]
MKQIRKRLTYANVMSSIAVFLIVGGATAFAALGKGTVGPRQLKKNAVKVGKLAPEAVRAGKLAKNAIATDRLRDNAVTSGKVSDSVQKSNDLLFATVAPATAAAAIKRGRGAQNVTRIGTGYYAVTFNRQITGCTWLATYGQPNNAGVNALWATVRGQTNTNQVGVVLRNAAGAQADGNGFHLAVLCP